MQVPSLAASAELRWVSVSISWYMLFRKSTEANFKSAGQEKVDQNLKSESMQKSTKVTDSWQGSKNRNRSSFADWYTLVSLQTLCSFFFEKSIRFREKRGKPFQAPPSISQAKNRVEIHHDSLDSRSNTTALGKKLIAKILSLTRR